MRKFSAAVGVLSTAALLLVPAAARADTSSSLTIIGTSDVSDSGLVQNLIEPEFHAAYPQYTFKYIGTASGTAINEAEAGSQGASALIVHAASLENQFVAGGFSYKNQYGYAIFRNDFVLAGPAADPAGVSGNATHNIAQAFADIATAGLNGTATFVSRGGSSGTTVQEHQIWGLVDHSARAPSRLLLCAVSAASGGGETPIASGNGVTANGQPCPNGGALPTGSQLPAWYAVTGLSQGPNVVAANACTGFASGANSCYVFTDRGTYDYLSSGLDPAGTIPNLTVLTRDDSESAPGGADELINYFHAYVINPQKPGESVNLPAAQDLITLLTSPGFQAQLRTYLDDTTDPAGPPFIADASPVITASRLPSTVRAGRTVTVTGRVTNAEPGYPVLAGKPVTVDELAAGIPVPVASGKTNSSGSYRITFKPRSTGSYQVTTAQISQIENATLSPSFGDILSPAATTPVTIRVTGLPTQHTVSFRRISQKRGALTVTGRLVPGPSRGGAKIELLALRAGAPGAEKKIAQETLGPGRTSFTIKVKLARGVRWVLQLEYVQTGQTSTYSRLKSVNVR